MVAAERVPASASAENLLENPNAPLVIAGQILCIVVPLAVWFAPLPLEPITKHGFAIVGFMVVAWITRAMDYALAGFVGCFLFWALGVVRFPVAFSGFANETAWFLFGALLLGVIATRSGIARRLAYFIMLHIGITYPRILLGLILTDFLLTFIVPSGIARVVIMASIALGLAEAFKSGVGSNVSRGMFLILSYTANIFDKMIIAGAGSITARGLIEKVGGVEVLWSYWFIAFLPCSIITVLAAWWLTLWLYPPETVALEGGYDYLRAEVVKMGPWSSLQKKAALLMAVAIVLWLTDFLHHISPAIVGMGVGLFALLPRVGILDIEDFETIELFAGLLRRRRRKHGHCAGGDQGARSPHDLHVRLDAALHDEYLHDHYRHVLDCVRLSLPAGQRDFDAWHVDSIGDGVCQIARYTSAAARHDLDILRRRKALRLSIGGPHRRLFIWIFRGARFVAYGRMAHRSRVPCSGPVLLAADWS
jgi:hypothetical protein